MSNGKFKLTEAAVEALIEKADNNDVSAEVLFEVFSRGIVAWSEDTRKTTEQYAFNRVDSFLSGGYASHLDKDLFNETTLDNSKEELIEGKRINDRTRHSVVNLDATARVKKRYTQKNKNMHHAKVTGNYIGKMDKEKQVVKRKDHLGRSIDVKGHLVKEGVAYIEKRIMLHNAHAEASRLFAGNERDPELRRLDRHREKKHKHAARVLDIIKTYTAKKKK